MNRVYVVIHPEASHHVERLVGGWYDSRLTERGLREAAQIAGYLRAMLPSDVMPRLVSSDLLRTRQTAEAIADALGVDLELDADLREKSYGIAEGGPQSWLDERFVFPPTVGERLDHDEGIEGGETKRAWIERAYTAMEWLEAEPAEHRVIVTHGGTANWVVAAWMRIPVEACAYVGFRALSGSVTILEEDDRFHNRVLAMLGNRNFVC